MAVRAGGSAGRGWHEDGLWRVGHGWRWIASGSRLRGLGGPVLHRVMRAAKYPFDFNRHLCRDRSQPDDPSPRQVWMRALGDNLPVRFTCIGKCLACPFTEQDAERFPLGLRGWNVCRRNTGTTPLIYKGGVRVPLPILESFHLSHSCPTWFNAQKPVSTFLRTPRDSARCIRFRIVSGFVSLFVPPMSRSASESVRTERVGQAPFVPLAQAKISPHSARALAMASASRWAAFKLAARPWNVCILAASSQPRRKHDSSHQAGNEELDVFRKSGVRS